MDHGFLEVTHAYEWILFCKHEEVLMPQLCKTTDQNRKHKITFLPMISMSHHQIHPSYHLNYP